MTVTDPSPQYLQDCIDSIHLTAIQVSPTQLNIYPRRGNGDSQLIQKLFDPNDRVFLGHRGFWVVTNLSAYPHVTCVQIAGEAYKRQLMLPEGSCNDLLQ